MDNLTHTLTGAVLGDLVRPASPSSRDRAVFLTAGAVAANLPDIDLAYTAITAAPLGYLLHHRGHSHTVPGLIALGLLLAAALRIWPAYRACHAAHARSLGVLLSAGLASHLLLDAANSYGTHLLYPLSKAWYYGDAVFIFEPWAWLILGICLATSATRPAARVLAWGAVIGPPALLALAGLVQLPVLVLLLIGGGLCAWGAPRIGPRRRAVTALAALTLLFTGLGGLSLVAKNAVRAHMPGGPGAVVDIVTNANPGAPWCWLVVAVTREDDVLGVRRGSVSLLPGMQPAASCASHRLTAAQADRGASPAVSWSGFWRQDVGQLRELAARDCWTAAWLQFGRVPWIADGRIVDLRFDNPLRYNFTAMPVPGDDGCPGNLTDWTAPRFDLLETGP